MPFRNNEKIFEPQSNPYVTRYYIHAAFSHETFTEPTAVPRDPNQIQPIPLTTYSIMCTAYAICDHMIDSHPDMQVSEVEYAWFLLMACVYVHRSVSDDPYCNKTFADHFGMHSDFFLNQYLHFCKVLMDLPFSPKRFRTPMPLSIDTRKNMHRHNEYTGPIIRVHPFQL
jgi:hypothetical protein